MTANMAGYVHTGCLWRRAPGLSPVQLWSQSLVREGRGGFAGGRELCRLQNQGKAMSRCMCQDPMGALIFGNDLKERVPAYALCVEKWRGAGRMIITAVITNGAFLWY